MPGAILNFVLTSYSISALSRLLNIPQFWWELFVPHSSDRVERDVQNLHLLAELNSFGNRSASLTHDRVVLEQQHS